MLHARLALASACALLASCFSPPQTLYTGAGREALPDLDVGPSQVARVPARQALPSVPSDRSRGAGVASVLADFFASARITPTAPTAEPAPGFDAAILPPSVADAVTLEASPPLKLDTTFASASRIMRFSYASSALGPAGRRAIAEMAPLAKAAARVEIRGRTDQAGDAGKNERLAIARATSVRTAFLSQGVPRAKLRATYCTVCFASADARDNRRVEVELILPAAQVAALPSAVYDKRLPAARVAHDNSRLLVIALR